ncbi:hypothetical protein ACV3Z2_14420 [Clostridium perfringens]
MQISLACVRDILISINKSNDLHNLFNLEYPIEELNFNIDKLTYSQLIEITDSFVTLTNGGKILLSILTDDCKYKRLNKRLSEFRSMSMALILAEAQRLNY